MHMNAYEWLWMHMNDCECIWYQYQYTNVYNRQLIFVLMCPTFSRSCPTIKSSTRSSTSSGSSGSFLDHRSWHNGGRGSSQSSVNCHAVRSTCAMTFDGRHEVCESSARHEKCGRRLLIDCSLIVIVFQLSRWDQGPPPQPEVLDPMHWYDLRPAHEQSIEPFQAWPVLKRMSRIDDEIVIK